jgi:hypothetical protein
MRVKFWACLLILALGLGGFSEATFAQCQTPSAPSGTGPGGTGGAPFSCLPLNAPQASDYILGGSNTSPQAGDTGRWSWSQVWTNTPLITPSFMNNATVYDSGSHPAGVMLTFPSLTALRAFSAANIGTNMVSAQTSGYTTPGDGGASVFDWNATSTANIDNVFVVSGNVGTGRWILRTPGGTIHPEQAGAKCDNTTDDFAALLALTNAINSITSQGETSTRIALNPGKICLFVSGSWFTPWNSVVQGGMGAALTNAVNSGINLFTSGFSHPPSVYLGMGLGSELRDVIVVRQGLPAPPTTYQATMAQVMGLWNTENGAITNVQPVGGTSGSGCTINDVVWVKGNGQGNPEWLQISAVDGGGGATAFNVLQPGAYVVFPTQPTLTTIPSSRRTTTCSPLPSVTFTTGTAQSVGVNASSQAKLENVKIVGFNLGIRGTSAVMRDISIDDINGVDVSQNGGNGFYENIQGNLGWTTMAGGFGVASLTSVQTGGSANVAGDVLNVTSGTCSSPPQITVDTVSGGALVTGHVSYYGICTVGATTNPSTLTNLHSGTPATVNLLWTTPDYRPGTGLYVHDQCDACYFHNIGTSGFQTSVDFSNVWSVSITHIEGEPYFNINLPAPPVQRIGLQTRNCTQLIATDVREGGFNIDLNLLNTTGANATLPGYNCENSGVTTTNDQSNVTIVGGAFSSSTASTNLINLGPYSRGVLENIQLTTAGITSAVNVQANVYGWALMNMIPFGPNVGTWITIDPTSVSQVVYSMTTPDGGVTPSHLVTGLMTKGPFTIGAGNSQIPTCTSGLTGAEAVVTDGAATPIYNATQTGGGSTAVPVMCTGSAWTNH